MFSEIDWPAVGEALQASVPSMIAAIVAWVGVQQWVTARNKLAMELFDRRFAAWQAYARALEDYLTAITDGRTTDGVLEPVPTPEGQAFLFAQSGTRYLFGADFHEKVGEMSEHIAAMEQVGPGGTMYRAMLKHVFKLRWELEDIAERYMMLGHIGVARPPMRLPAWARRLLLRLRRPPY